MIGDSKLCDLDFADDIALLADSKENMRKVNYFGIEPPDNCLGLLCEKNQNNGSGKHISGEVISIIGEDIEIADS